VQPQESALNSHPSRNSSQVGPSLIDFAFCHAPGCSPQLVRSSAWPLGLAGFGGGLDRLFASGLQAQTAAGGCPAQPLRDARGDVTQGNPALRLRDFRFFRKACPYKLIPTTIDS